LKDRFSQALNDDMANTCKLWRTIFDEDYFFPGAMFRGNRPNKVYDLYDPKILLNEVIKFSQQHRKRGKFRLNYVKMYSENPLSKDKRDFILMEDRKFKVIRYPNGKSQTLYEGDVMLDYPLKFTEWYEFDEIDEKKSFDLKVTMIYKSDFDSKFVNVMKTGHRHDPKYDLDFTPEFLFSQNQTENHEFKVILPHRRAHELAVELSWDVEREFEKLSIDFKKQKFSNVRIRDMFESYQAFDFKIKYFEGIYGEAIRAIHDLAFDFKSTGPFKFNIEVLHIYSLKWSSIKIISSTGKLAVTSNSIGI
jgi:hypothetical protein